jgi:hypothetical protein
VPAWFSSCASRVDRPPAGERSKCKPSHKWVSLAPVPIADLVYRRHDVPGTSLQLISDWTETHVILERQTV